MMLTQIYHQMMVAVYVMQIFLILILNFKVRLIWNSGNLRTVCSSNHEYVLLTKLPSLDRNSGWASSSSLHWSARLDSTW